MSNLTTEPSLTVVAERLLLLLESDFRRSDTATRLELIRVELEAAYQRGREDGSSLPDSIQEALNSGDGVYRP